MADGSVNVPKVAEGVQIDNTQLTRDGKTVYRQRVEAYQANSFGDLTADAWGVPKISKAESLFHGLWTFDVPADQWLMYENGAEVSTSINITSSNGALLLSANATKHTLVLESKNSPRYQPNRGHLYSTAVWCPSKTADGIRAWGVGTSDNGVLFRLKSDGNLYAVLRSGGVEVKEELIDTSAVSGFDVQKGNVYDIQYQWRGVGNYKFYINLVHVHTFDNLGTLTALSIENPALPALFSCQRISDDVSLYSGCVDISSENGTDDKLTYTSAYAEATLNGTDIPLIAIYNPAQINSKVNTRLITVARITLFCDKKVVYKIWRTRDATALTGATFAAIGSGSYVQTDSPDTVTGAVKATAVTTSKMALIAAITTPANTPREWTQPDPKIELQMARGDYLVVTATVVTGACEGVVEWGEAV